MVDTKKLRGYIVMAGHTQQSVAKGIGVSQSTFSCKMNGHRAFDVDEANKVCEILDSVYTRL